MPRELVCTSVRRDKEFGKFEVRFTAQGEWLNPPHLSFVIEGKENFVVGAVYNLELVLKDVTKKAVENTEMPEPLPEAVE